MSRGRNARRKARRREARLAAAQQRSRRPAASRRLSLLVPVLAIAAILAATAALGFDFGNGTSRAQVDQEVDGLLAGIPQHGNTLGSPQAPIALQVFADLECPTVKLFVENYLPSLIDNWVRPGKLKLVYRSLKTDTADEHTFFKQEVAALAAGRQDQMWNFALTFVREQGTEFTAYATGGFLTGIAAQVPGLKREMWRKDQTSSVLMKQVALGVREAHARHLRSTPAFLIRFAPAGAGGVLRTQWAATRREFLAGLRRDVDALKAEATKDAPTVGLFNVLK